MLRFPTGIFNAYVLNDQQKGDTLFIPFENIKSDAIRFGLGFDIFHTPKGKEIPESKNEALQFSMSDNHLFLIDKAEWLKNKGLIYSTKSNSYDSAIKEINSKGQGNTILLPFEDISKTKISDEKNTRRFYFAYMGYTLDGDPAYIWINKRK